MNRPRGVRWLIPFAWRTRRQVAADVDDELQFHLDCMAAQLRAQGWSEGDARTEAIRRFGDLNYTRNYCRAQDYSRERGRRRVIVLDELVRDLRYSLRSLAASPGFAAVALLTLALGIGANTAIFSVVRGVLLEPLPFREADRLVRVWHANQSSDIPRGPVSEPDFLDWREQSRTAQSMGGFFYADGLSGMDFTGSGEPERLAVALVTDGFFETLGTPAFRGRPLLPEENVEGRAQAVVLSHGLWTRRFGADESLVGGTVTLGGEPFHVVGVMPEGFTFPAEGAIDAWIPLAFFGPDDIGRVRPARFMGVIARLAPGATEANFRNEVATIASRIATEHPENAGWDNVTVLSLRESIVGEVKRPLIVLMAAVTMLLLIACVNIASLLLARATGRRQELAVRAALGAGRGRIARQLLTESLVLALLGGALGTALGVAAVRALAAAGASELPRAADIRVDGMVLAFTLGVSVLAGLLFGLVPALRASSGLERSLRAGGRGSVGGGGQKLRSGLVMAEVALAVILVVGAALATKSFNRLLSVDPGFRTSNALVAMLSIPEQYDAPEARREYYYGMLESIRAVPGVQSAGAIRDLPLLGAGELVRPNLEGTREGEAPTVQLHQVSTDYFTAIGTPVAAGRTFEMTDRMGAPLVVVVNEEMARRVWPGENPIGRTLRLGATAEFLVVGVVGNVRQRGLTEPVEPAIYLHALQNQRSRMSIVVRTSGDPLQYAGAVRQAIWSQNPTQAITRLTTLDSVLGDAVARPRLLAWLLGLFGVTGLVLGALGIFGVLAYAVSQRRQEIGVRVALGAPPGAVMRLIVGQGLVLAAAGVLVGVAGALLLTSSMQSVLYGIQPSDPATFVQVVLVLMGAAVLASWLPARRALAIDPVAALKYD